MRIFSDKEKNDICQRYISGETEDSIRKSYHCRDEAVKRVLQEVSIPIKRKGCCINRLLKENYFSKIETEGQAYFLGLLFTDGSVIEDKSRSPMISLSLKESDFEILEDLKKELQLSCSLKHDKRTNKKSCILSFRNKIIANDLQKYGIVPNKTYLTKKMPEIEDKELLRHFLRGCLDGDGSLYRENKSGKYRIDFCSYHKTICEDFQKYCNLFLNIKNKNKIANYSKSSIAYHVRFNRQDSVKQLVSILYDNCNFYIKRKFLIAQEIIKS